MHEKILTNYEKIFLKLLSMSIHKHTFFNTKLTSGEWKRVFTLESTQNVLPLVVEYASENKSFHHCIFRQPRACCTVV